MWQQYVTIFPCLQYSSILDRNSDALTIRRTCALTPSGISSESLLDSPPCRFVGTLTRWRTPCYPNLPSVMQECGMHRSSDRSSDPSSSSSSSSSSKYILPAHRCWGVLENSKRCTASGMITYHGCTSYSGSAGRISIDSIYSPISAPAKVIVHACAAPDFIYMLSLILHLLHLRLVCHHCVGSAARLVRL